MGVWFFLADPGGGVLVGPIAITTLLCLLWRGTVPGCWGCSCPVLGLLLAPLSWEQPCFCCFLTLAATNTLQLW